VKQYLVICLFIVTIKEFAGKYRKLNSCKTNKTNLSSFNREYSVFLSNQRPDDKDNMKHSKLSWKDIISLLSRQLKDKETFIVCY